LVTRSVIGSMLASMLAGVALGPSLAVASPPSPERVWVFFRDPGRTSAELEAELAARRVELGTRTLLRRAKVRTDGLVDARDLLPAADYVAAVEHTGAQLRHESRWLNAVSVDADADTQRALAALPFAPRPTRSSSPSRRWPPTRSTTASAGRSSS